MVSMVVEEGWEQGFIIVLINYKRLAMIIF